MSKIENIHYQTNGIATYFDHYRDKWDDFYPSERWAFERLAGTSGYIGSILDVGCAVGGLGLALSNRFKVKDYVGVDINQQAIDKARSVSSRFSVPVRFECGDILKLSNLNKESFDVVFSLSCADWNVDTNGIINRCWEYVKPEGSFVISVRLTPEEGINDITKSYQPISCNEEGKALEYANYVVFNWRDFFGTIEQLMPIPSDVSGYGYWGKPASNAVTLYKELVFAVFIIKKGTDKKRDIKTNSELFLPLSLFTKDKHSKKRGAVYDRAEKEY